MAIPIASFTFEDFILLGPPISHLIVTTLAAIHDHHHLVTITHSSHSTMTLAVRSLSAPASVTGRPHDGMALHVTT